MAGNKKDGKSVLSMNEAKLNFINASMRLESAKLKLAQVPTLTGFIAGSSSTKGETEPSA